MFTQNRKNQKWEHLRLFYVKLQYTMCYLVTYVQLVNFTEIGLAIRLQL